MGKVLIPFFAVLVLSLGFMGCQTVKGEVDDPFANTEWRSYVAEGTFTGMAQYMLKFNDSGKVDNGSGLVEYKVVKSDNSYTAEVKSVMRNKLVIESRDATEGEMYMMAGIIIPMKKVSK